MDRMPDDGGQWIRTILFGLRLQQIEEACRARQISSPPEVVRHQTAADQQTQPEIAFDQAMGVAGPVREVRMLRLAVGKRSENAGHCPYFGFRIGESRVALAQLPEAFDPAVQWSEVAPFVHKGVDHSRPGKEAAPL